MVLDDIIECIELRILSTEIETYSDNQIVVVSKRIISQFRNSYYSKITLVLIS